MSLFGDSMRPYLLRHSSTIDQQLAFLRTAWESATPEDRDRMEQYLFALVQLPQPGNLGFVSLSPLRIELNYEFYDDDGQAVEGDEARLTPKVILAAIEDWRKGIDHTPKIGFGFNNV